MRSTEWMSREIVKGTGRRDRVRDAGKQREWVRGAGLQREVRVRRVGYVIHWTHRAKHTCRCTCKYTGKHRYTET